MAFPPPGMRPPLKPEEIKRQKMNTENSVKKIELILENIFKQMLKNLAKQIDDEIMKIK